MDRAVRCRCRDPKADWGSRLRLRPLLSRPTLEPDRHSSATSTGAVAALPGIASAADVTPDLIRGRGRVTVTVTSTAPGPLTCNVNINGKSRRRSRS